MKIKSYVQENGKWVFKQREINVFKHYWYSMQIILPYYWNRFIEFLEGEKQSDDDLEFEGTGGKE